ncbi:MAG: hypothetical protein E7162_05920 [Firmicutes bacterium]|nr:hypothetical protein [Bacillota bacterium]
MKKLNIKFNLSLKIFLIVFLIITCILIGLLINSTKKEEIKLNKYKSDYINFTYYNNFNVYKQKDHIILTTKDKKTNIVIKKIDYTSNTKTKDKYEISSSLSYQVVENKKEYIETYNGIIDNNYYFLYEDYQNKRQIEVINIFDDNYIFTIIYSASNKEFDLYKESIDLIINSINV